MIPFRFAQVINPFRPSFLKCLAAMFMFVLAVLSLAAHAQEKTAGESETDAKPTGSTEEAIAFYNRAMIGPCRPYEETKPLFSDDGEEMPIRHELDPTDYLGNPDPGGDKPLLFEFFCDTGAYNARWVYILFLPYDGFQIASLPYAVTKVTYEKEDDFESPVKSVDLMGFSARHTATNPVFEPKTRQLSETALWRGLGDASEEQVWEFRGEGFVLVSYRLDAQYDGMQSWQYELDWPAKP